MCAQRVHCCGMHSAANALRHVHCGTCAAASALRRSALLRVLSLCDPRPSLSEAYMWYQCENMSRVTSAQSTAPEGEGESSGQVLWTCLIDVSLRTCRCGRVVADVSWGRVLGTCLGDVSWGRVLRTCRRVSAGARALEEGRGGRGVSGECHADLGSLSESVSEVSRKWPRKVSGKCLGSVPRRGAGRGSQV